VELLSHLVALKPMCIQLSHSGVIEFTGGDTATARFTERQRGKGSDDCYENLAVHHDEFVRLDDPGSSGAAITTATLMRPPSRASLFSSRGTPTVVRSGRSIFLSDWNNRSSTV